MFCVFEGCSVLPVKCLVGADKHPCAQGLRRCPCWPSWLSVWRLLRWTALLCRCLLLVIYQSFTSLPSVPPWLFITQNVTPDSSSDKKKKKKKKKHSSLDGAAASPASPAGAAAAPDVSMPPPTESFRTPPKGAKAGGGGGGSSGKKKKGKKSPGTVESAKKTVTFGTNMEKGERPAAAAATGVVWCCRVRAVFTSLSVTLVSSGVLGRKQLVRDIGCCCVECRKAWLTRERGEGEEYDMIRDMHPIVWR